LSGTSWNIRVPLQEAQPLTDQELANYCLLVRNAPRAALESTTRKRKSFCSSVSVNFLIHLFPTALFNTELVLSKSDNVENVMNQKSKSNVNSLTLMVAN